MLHSGKKALTLWAGIALVVSLATAAQAFDAPTIELEDQAGFVVLVSPVLPALAVAGAEDDAGRSRWIDRVSGAMQRIPLRPVKIGREPRRPDDPKVGFGLVVKIPF